MISAAVPNSDVQRATLSGYVAESVHYHHGWSQMARLKSADKVEALRRQQIEIAAKLKEAEAADREQKKERQRRRHELAGRAGLYLLESKPDSSAAKAFQAALIEVLKRPADRALFPELAAAAKAGTPIQSTPLPPDAEQTAA